MLSGAQKRGRGRPRKDSSQEITQASETQASKRGAGRARKAIAEPRAQETQTKAAKQGRGTARKAAAQPPAQQTEAEMARRGRGRPRKISTQSAIVKSPAHARKRVIKQEPEKPKGQPQRGAKPVLTIEAQGSGTTKLMKMSRNERRDPYTIASSPISSPPSSPPKRDRGKRKAVEEAPARPAPKRRTIKQEYDKENERLRKLWSSGAYN